MKRLEGMRFVEIAAKGKAVVSTTGEIGTAGETQTTQHHNPAVAARAAARRRVQGPRVSHRPGHTT